MFLRGVPASRRTSYRSRRRLVVRHAPRSGLQTQRHMTELSPRERSGDPTQASATWLRWGLRRAVDPSARVTEAQPALTGRVLLVDDEQRIVNFVRRGLEAEGLEVDTAAGGEEGLRLARSRTYDLLILDLVMPDVDGLSVLQQILERKPAQPVLVLSALSDT